MGDFFEAVHKNDKKWVDFSNAALDRILILYSNIQQVS